MSLVDRANRCGIINEEDFNREDVAQDERDNYREASSMVSIIFEQIKGIVHDTWAMHIEEEERVRQARFNRSRIVFGLTEQDVVQLGPRPPIELGSQGTTTGNMYDNDNNVGALKQHQGEDQRGRQEPMDQVQQQMMLLTGMMSHMKQEAERSARRDELSLEMAKRKEERESKQEANKLNFTNMAAKVPPFMRPLPAKQFFGGRSISEVTTAELRKYIEQIASFVETVDHEAGQLNKLIKTVSRFTYRPASRGSENDGVESMVSTATENYKNSQACHTKVGPHLTEYGDLPAQVQKLDEGMFVFIVSLFDPLGVELAQYRSRTKEHPELMLYSELMLYLFHTKAGSPIHMWSTQQDEILEVEKKVPWDIRNTSMAAMREGFGALLDELETNCLEPWQVAVVKLHTHAVRTGCKDTVQALEQNVLNFLASTQDGPEVRVPNVCEWTHRVMDGIEANKEYFDARMSTRKSVTRVSTTSSPDTQKQTQAISKQVEPPKRVQAFDQGGNNMATGTCLKCKSEFMGPARDRGDITTTWHKYCPACHQPRHRGTNSPRNVHQVEEVNLEDEEDIDGPADVF